MWIALAATLLTLAPQDEIFSGPQKGEKTAGFTVFDLEEGDGEWNYQLLSAEHYTLSLTAEEMTVSFDSSQTDDRAWSSAGEPR